MELLSCFKSDVNKTENTKTLINRGFFLHKLLSQLVIYI